LRYCRERDRDLVGIAISDMIFYRHIVAIYELFIKYIHHQHNFNCNQINYFEIESDIFRYLSADNEILPCIKARKNTRLDGKKGTSLEICQF
jgi:hypothetical protein